MVPGVNGSAGRPVPFSTIYSTTTGATASGLGCLLYDGTSYLYRDPNDADIMSSSLPNVFTDLVTTGIDGSGNMTYENGRYFVCNTTVNSVMTGTVLTSLANTITAEDVRYVIWYPAAGLYVALGADTAVNGLVMTSSTGLTGSWTTRADVFSAEKVLMGATDGTVLVVGGTNGKIARTTSTTAPFTWTSPTWVGNTTQNIVNLRYFPNTADGNTWVACQQNGITAFSTNAGSTWTLKTIFDSNNRASPAVMWSPSLNKWLAATSGSSQSTRGRILAYSNTSSYTGTWTLSAENTTAGELLSGGQYITNNSYWVTSTSTTNQIRYIRL